MAITKETFWRLRKLLNDYESLADYCSSEAGLDEEDHAALRQIEADIAELERMTGFGEAIPPMVSCEISPEIVGVMGSWPQRSSS